LNHHSKIIQFCPYCGNKTEEKIVNHEKRITCPNCDWVHYEDPKVAAAVVIFHNNELLLTRRVFNPHKGLWTLPAGFVNAYEDPKSAACRECLEETGLVVRISGLIDMISGREHPRGADMIIVYAAEVIGGTLIAGDDADLVNFFPLDQLPELAFQATKQVVQLLKDNPFKYQ